MSQAVFKYVAPAVVMMLAAPAALAQSTRFVEDAEPEAARPVSRLSVDGVLEFMVTVANILIAFVAIISVIMIIYGGFKYATGGSSSEKVTEARNTILYGVIGLAVALLAFAVVAFANDLVGNIRG